MMRAIYVDKDLPRMLAVKALRPIWPGVIWSPISHAHVVRIEEPPLPGPHWIRVRNRQCGLCGTDLSFLMVEADPEAAPVALPGHERIYLGHEVVSEVVEVGRLVSRVRVGDRVIMGSRYSGPTCLSQEIDPPCRFCAAGQTRLCENASLGRGPAGVGGGWGDGYTAHESEVFRIPSDIEDDSATLIEPVSVALHAVLRRPPEPGSQVLVMGAGTIGLLTVQCLRAVAPDCRISVLARHPHQVAAARRFGAEEILAGDDLYAEAARITGAHLYRAPMNRGMLLGGFSRVYDCVGSRETIVNGLRWARAGGAVVLVGISLASLKVDLNPVWYQEVDLLGSHTYGMEDFRGRQAHTFQLVTDMLQSGELRPGGIITHRFPLDDYRRAVHVATHRSGGAIKVMFTM